MSLLLRGRWAATRHWWTRFQGLRGHRICRVYRFFGLDTLAVFCDCGEVFAFKPRMSGGQSADVGRYLGLIRRHPRNRVGKGKARAKVS